MINIKYAFCKYNYLIRIIVVCFVAMCIPFLSFGLVITNRSFEKMEEKNKAYYLENTNYFANYFNEQLLLLTNHALNIGFERRLSPQTIESHNWYVIEALESLFDYKKNVPICELCGIHFKGKDYMLTSNYKYYINYFSDKYSQNSEELSQNITHFFTSEHEGLNFFVSTFNEFEYDDAVLIVGIPVCFGSGIKPDGIVFYVLTYDSLNTSFLKTLGLENYGFYVLDDNNNVLYTNQTLNKSLLSNEDFRSFVDDAEATQFEYLYDKNFYNVFKVLDKKTRMTFVCIVAREEVVKNLFSFYNKLRTTFFITSIAFIMLLALTVYINYKPIWDLTKSIRKTHENKNIGIYEGELKFIEQSYNKLSSESLIMFKKVSEQKLMLMDYILSNLIDGIIISEDQIKQLDINLEGKKFFLLSIFELYMDNMERENFSIEISKICDCDIYITDLPNENHIIFICTINENSIQLKLVEFIEKNLRKYHNRGFKIGIGSIVNNINDIRISYLDSLYKFDLENSSLFYENWSNTSLSNSIYFPDETLRFLQYIQCGDKNEALIQLKNITTHIESNINQMLLKRYVCNNIIDLYVKTLNKLNIFLSKQETVNIINFCTIEEYYNLMSISINAVCLTIICRNQDSIESFHKSILNFIDKYYTSPDMSLVKVADEFNLSIYTLSRTFKQYTGIGFNEYITAKRIETGKQMLLTTEKKIQDIARNVGLYDADYFTKLFKINCGTTPSKFRKGNY